MSILIENVPSSNSFLDNLLNIPDLPSYVYVPNHAHASQPRSVTIQKIIQMVKDAFIIKKNNSFVYSHRSRVTKSFRNRFRRLSRRVLLCKFMQILLCAYDIKTGELHDNILESSLAIYAGTSLRNMSRLIRLFKKRGWIIIKQISKMGDNGKMYAEPAKKYLTPKFFIDAIGQRAWDLVCQYQRWKIQKVGEQKCEEAYNKRISARKTERPILDWKEEAIAKQQAKLIDKGISLKGDVSIIDKLISGITQAKTVSYKSSTSLYDAQRPIQKEDYYESYSHDPRRTYAEPSTSPKSPPVEPLIKEIQPVPLCHVEFKAPQVNQTPEQRKEAAKNAMSQIFAKLGMKRSADPP